VEYTEEVPHMLVLFAIGFLFDKRWSGDDLLPAKSGGRVLLLMTHTERGTRLFNQGSDGFGVIENIIPTLSTIIYGVVQKIQ
jgi:hypothetical protein